ncbi:MAG: polysaccharide biosynthesis/export family protein [Gemmataceae bacterium]
MSRPSGRRRNAHPFAVVLIAVICVLPCGCANLFGLSPSGHRLIPQAKQLRSAYADPLPIPRELDKRFAQSYVVEPGDVLLVQPINLDSPVRLPGDQTVLPDGTIHLGRYGQMIVAGKTTSQIESEVRAIIGSRQINAGPITARLVTRVSKVYYVLGEVNAPGAFPLQGRETVLDALLAAGGLNDKASRKFITLARPTHPDGCRVVMPICYSQIVQLGDTSTNYQIAAGDRIYVPTRGCDDRGRKKVCAPCGRPQSPCPPPEGCPVGQPSVPPDAWPTPTPLTILSGKNGTRNAFSEMPLPQPKQLSTDKLAD